MTYALLALWTTVGIVVYLVVRQRRLRKKRLAQVEQQLVLWVESERKRGKSVAAIAEQLDAKRKELADKAGVALED